ncbi:MAG: YafY family transcriptional regulator [Ignavibacteria bacterium]|nr:YafY family transcriptional regulator [Ignavibacteria bacterium]
MSKLIRYFGIVLQLHTKKVIRAEDLAEHFDVSVRTIYRDFRALEEAGVPIAAEAGVGYSLASGYHLPPVMFTEEEASALFLGGEFLKQTTDEALQKQTISALLKIRAILPRDKKIYLEKLQESVSIQARSPWLSNNLSNDILNDIQHAVVHRFVLKIGYHAQSNNDTTIRDVEPLGLMYYGDHWHLVGYCRLRLDLRDFRVDRIQTLEKLPDTFAVRPDFSIKNFIRQELRLEHPIEVKLHFPKSYARFATSKYYYGLVEEIENEDGVMMTFLVPSLEWIARWVLSFAEKVTVIHPQELSGILIEGAQKVVDKYS